MGTKQDKAQSEMRSVAKRSKPSSTDANDSEQSIAEFRRLSGQGHSQGERFAREEIHERK